MRGLVRPVIACEIPDFLKQLEIPSGPRRRDAQVGVLAHATPEYPRFAGVFRIPVFAIFADFLNDRFFFDFDIRVAFRVVGTPVSDEGFLPHVNMHAFFANRADRVVHDRSRFGPGRKLAVAIEADVSLLPGCRLAVPANRVRSAFGANDSHFVRILRLGVIVQ